MVLYCYGNCNAGYVGGVGDNADSFMKLTPQDLSPDIWTLSISEKREPYTLEEPKTDWLDYFVLGLVALAGASFINYLIALLWN